MRETKFLSVHRWSSVNQRRVTEFPRWFFREFPADVSSKWRSQPFRSEVISNFVGSRETRERGRLIFRRRTVRSSCSPTYPRLNEFRTGKVAIFQVSHVAGSVTFRGYEEKVEGKKKKNIKPEAVKETRNSVSFTCSLKENPRMRGEEIHSLRVSFQPALIGWTRFRLEIAASTNFLPGKSYLPHKLSSLLVN